MLRRIIGYLLVVSGLAIFSLFAYKWIFGDDVSLLNFSGALLLSLMMFYQGRVYVNESKPKPELSTFLQKDSEQKETEPAYDPEKRTALIQKLKSLPEPVIPVLEFLDGNYADYGSIGCNIHSNHPGIDTFRDVFEALLKRDDVDSIYAHISEIEPDEDCWPYSDRVYVFGTISTPELEAITKSIQPTEIGDRKDIFSPIPKDVRSLSSEPLNCLWWD